LLLPLLLALALLLLLFTWALARASRLRERAAARIAASRRPEALSQAPLASGGVPAPAPRPLVGERVSACPVPGRALFLPAFHLAQVGRKGCLHVDLDHFPAPALRHVFLLGLERALADACAGSDSLEPARWLVNEWRDGRLAKPGEARHRRTAR
jgi:hypothetical protein